jgi:ADP-ribose pyrophosphatase
MYGILAPHFIAVTTKRTHPMDLKLLKRDIIHRGKVFNIIVDQIEYPSGNKGVREVVEHPGGAAILAVLPDQQVVLIKQRRYPVDRILYELPAGKLDKDEDPAHCAARELTEETGYVAGHLEKITAIYTSPGFCSECLHIFLATDLKLTQQNLEEGEEHIEVHIVPLGKAIKMVEQGMIVDGKTIVGLMLGERKLGTRELSPHL